jgi:hypothetical protein
LIFVYILFGVKYEVVAWRCNKFSMLTPMVLIFVYDVVVTTSFLDPYTTESSVYFYIHFL